MLNQSGRKANKETVYRGGDLYKEIVFRKKNDKVGGEGGGGSFMLEFGWGDRERVSYFFSFLICFCAVVNCSFTAGKW